MDTFIGYTDSFTRSSIEANNSSVEPFLKIGAKVINQFSLGAVFSYLPLRCCPSVHSSPSWPEEILWMPWANDFTLVHPFPFNYLSANTCLYSTSIPHHLLLSEGSIFPTYSWFPKEGNNEKALFKKKFSSLEILPLSLPLSIVFIPWELPIWWRKSRRKGITTNSCPTLRAF